LETLWGPWKWKGSGSYTDFGKKRIKKKKKAKISANPGETLSLGGSRERGKAPPEYVKGNSGGGVRRAPFWDEKKPSNPVSRVPRTRHDPTEFLGVVEGGQEKRGGSSASSLNSGAGNLQGGEGRGAGGGPLEPCKLIQEKGKAEERSDLGD